MNKIKKQLIRVRVHILNSIQKTILGDDFISIILRNQLLRLMGVKVGKNVKILGGSDILGRHMTICDGVFINRGCYFDLTGHLYIADNVGIGHGTTFITAKHEIGPPENRAGHVVKNLISGGSIRLEKGSWVAANVTVLSDVTIGEGAVVATGAVVIKDVDSNIMVGGLPAKCIKALEN